MVAVTVKLLVDVGRGAAETPDTAPRFRDQMPVEGDVNWGDVPRVYVMPLTVTVNTGAFFVKVGYVPVMIGVVVGAAWLITVGAVVVETEMFCDPEPEIE